jgi:carbamoyltransferase
LNAFHPDSTACVLKDGKLVAAVAEERLGPRLNHVAGFPGASRHQAFAHRRLSLECSGVIFGA